MTEPSWAHRSLPLSINNKAWKKTSLGVKQIIRAEVIPLRKINVGTSERKSWKAEELSHEKKRPQTDEIKGWVSGCWKNLLQSSAFGRAALIDRWELLIPLWFSILASSPPRSRGHPTNLNKRLERLFSALTLPLSQGTLCLQSHKWSTTKYSYIESRWKEECQSSVLRIPALWKLISPSQLNINHRFACSRWSIKTQLRGICAMFTGNRSAARWITFTTADSPSLGHFPPSHLEQFESGVSTSSENLKSPLCISQTEEPCPRTANAECGWANGPESELSIFLGLFCQGGGKSRGCGCAHTHLSRDTSQKTKRSTRNQFFICPILSKYLALNALKLFFQSGASESWTEDSFFLLKLTNVLNHNSKSVFQSLF